MLRNTQTNDKIALIGAQQSMYLFEKLYPNSAAYHYTIVCDLDGDLDVVHFGNAVQMLMQRHETLRSCIIDFWGKPYLAPISDNIFPFLIIPCQNAERLAPEALPNTLEGTEWEEFVDLPFNLNQGPLWRCALLQFANNRFQFVFVAHHIIVDASSRHILLDDISKFYNAFLDQQSLQLPEIPPLSALSTPDNTAEKLETWKKVLKDLIPLYLRTDFNPPVDRTFRGDRLGFVIHPATIGRLNEIANAYHSSLHGIFFASLYVLLHRITGQSDICLGTASANRRNYNHPVDGIVSSFVNSLPVRAQCEGQQRFCDFLEYLTPITHQAYRDQLPFDTIVDQAMGKREKQISNAGSPFDTIFNLNEAKPGFTLKNIQASYPTEIDLGYSKFIYPSFNFQILPPGKDGSSCRAYIEYCTDYFTRESMIQMLEQLQNIWLTVCQEPTFRIADISLLTEANKTLLTQANETEVKISPEDPHFFRDYFYRTVQRYPHRTAVVFHKSLEEKYSLSYKELNAGAEILAAHLRPALVQKKKDALVCVGISLPKSLELMVAMWAVFKTGATLMPLETQDHPKLSHKIEAYEKHLSFIIVNSDTEQTIKNSHSKITTINIDHWKKIHKLANAIGIWHNQKPLFENDIAYVTFTSGSTGIPKGIEVTQQGLANAARAIENRHLSDGCNVLNLAGPDFDAHYFDILQAVMTAGVQHIVQRSSSTFLQTLISQEEINAATFIPSDADDLNFSSLPSLQVVTVMGSMPKADIMQRLVQRVEETKDSTQPFEGGGEYGPSEATIFCTRKSLKRPLPHSAIGNAEINTKLFILDPYLHECFPGQPGELYIAGPSLAKGYLDNPELTQQRFIHLNYDKNEHRFHPPKEEKQNSNLIPIRLYKTGDKVRRLFDGSLDFIGRMEGNRQVKIHGVRLELEGVETVLQTHPDIKQAVVTFNPNHDSLNAYLILKNPFGSIERMALNEHLNRSSLPKVALLKTISTCEKFPLNANGKVDITILEQKASLIEDSNQFPEEPPLNDLQNHILRIWEKLLHIKIKSINMSWNVLGGDSFARANLEFRINKELNLLGHFSLAKFGRTETNPDNMTIRSLSNLLQPLIMPSLPSREGIFNPLHTNRSDNANSSNANSETTPAFKRQKSNAL